jgi:hypothetical protein
MQEGHLEDLMVEGTGLETSEVHPILMLGDPNLEETVFKTSEVLQMLEEHKE